jgi:hypothetical protein
LAAAVAAYVGFIGLQTWKKQLRGKTEYELAQRLLRATYQFREALTFARSPIPVDNGITETIMKVAGKGSPREISKAATLYEKVVREKRQPTVREASIELEAIFLEAEIIWGPVVQQYKTPLLHCADTLLSAIERHFALRQHPEIKIPDAEMKRISDIIRYLPNDSANFFSREIKEAVRNIENFRIRSVGVSVRGK